MASVLILMPGKMSPLPQPWATAGDSGDFFIGVDKSACSGDTRQSGTQMICRARSPSLRPLPRREPVNTPTSLTRVGGTMADSLGGALGAMIAQHGGHLALPSITIPNHEPGSPVSSHIAAASFWKLISDKTCATPVTAIEEIRTLSW